MGSMIACCESVCIADVNTLLRRYRDDLFFYFYVSLYNCTDFKTAKSMLEDYARWNGFPNPTHFTDEDISGVRFPRPAFPLMDAGSKR